MDSPHTPHIAIIIRTKNEERWIRHCLLQVFNQNYKNISVVIVDNQSTDSTLQIAQSFPILSVQEITDYTPGKALNIGVAAVLADYYVFLSAHCIPNGEQWLETLLFSIQQDTSIVGSYGRQIALPSSDEIDKRDLLMTFRAESRITSKDTFFHNANSIVRGTYIRNNLFDENISNAEDHIWGRRAIDQNFRLAYSAEAEVVHHHGLHQGSRKGRVSGVLRQLETSVMGNAPYLVPDSLTVNHNLFRCVLLIPSTQEIDLFDSIDRLIDTLSSVLNNFDICIVTSRPEHYSDYNCIHKNRILVLHRYHIGEPSSSVNELLINTKVVADHSLGHVDTYLYFNLNSPQISDLNLRFLVQSHLNNNNDITSFGQACYDDIWIEVDGEYQQVGTDVGKERSFRAPMFKLMRGYCTAFNSSVLNHSLSDAKNCIIPLENDTRVPL